MHPAAHIADLQMMASAAWAWLSSAGQAFGQKAADALVTSIWQGAVIVCTLEIATRLMPRVSAAHRFSVWAAGFGVAAGLPLLSLVHFGSNSIVSSSASSFTSGASHSLLQVDARWALVVAAIWALAAIVRAAGLVVHSFRLRRLWKAAEPVIVSDNLAAALKGVRSGRVAICTTEMLDRPSVIGFFAPRILVPKWLMGRVTPAELEQIVLHEAEHLRRRDDWTNLLQKLALVAFPVNPALAWMERHLCREREMACDEGVVRITNAPRAYAACLASLAERRLEQREEALSLGAWHRRSELVVRVHRILVHKPRMSRTAAGALLGTIGSLLVAGSVEMARCPQLIAFVPKQSTLTMTAAHQQQLAALLARDDAEAKITLPPGYHAVQAKAVMPVSQRAVRRANLKASSRPIATAAREQLAKAEQEGDRVVTSDGRQWVVLAAWAEVQTTAGETATTTVARDTSRGYRDYEMSADAPAPTEAAGQNTSAAQPSAAPAANQNKAPMHRFTVTQLILRVVPANPDSSSRNPKAKSTQPPTGAVRGGWFVIQL